MNSLKRAEKLWLKGEITEDEFLEYRRTYGKALTKSAEQIIAYLEAELNEAIELHDAAKENKDLAQAHAMLLKAYTISELLDVIKA
jgi:NTP pyrophosphatase (non-canonical NTP hydrolase)